MAYSILENKWIFNTLDFRQIYDNSTLFLMYSLGEVIDGNTVGFVVRQM